MTGSTSEGEAKKPRIDSISPDASDRAMWTPSCPSPENLHLLASCALFTWSK